MPYNSASAAVVTDTANPAEGTVRLVLSGTVDAQRVRTVHCSIIDALRRHRPARIDIDLAGATLLDAAGLHGLRLCRADAAQLDCRLLIVRAPVAIMRVLQFAGLAENPPETT
ncbi:STAS domain-containing protein [Actinoplanes sp. NPDC051411]|jgi:anti-anti-sigma regulatory factor|uniref:STAS domain-containing protein n=1 Tax=Actinoplanes sp. NPDC051411 TaxID=3155522 RepID=UPI00342BE9CD